MAAKNTVNMPEEIQYIRAKLDSISIKISDLAEKQASGNTTLTSMHNRLYAGNGHGGDIEDLSNRIKALEDYKVQLDLADFKKMQKQLSDGTIRIWWAAVAGTLVVVWEVFKYLYPILKH